MSTEQTTPQDKTAIVHRIIQARLEYWNALLAFEAAHNVEIDATEETVDSYAAACTDSSAELDDAAISDLEAELLALDKGGSN